jgi:hypothetical protein
MGGRTCVCAIRRICNGDCDDDNGFARLFWEIDFQLGWEWATCRSVPIVSYVAWENVNFFGCLESCAIIVRVLSATHYLHPPLSFRHGASKEQSLSHVTILSATDYRTLLTDRMLVTVCTMVGESLPRKG